MSVSRLAVVALTGLTLLLARGTPQQSNYVELNNLRLSIVKIPAGSFRMGSDQVIHAGDAWEPCSACPPRNEVERPVHRVTMALLIGTLRIGVAVDRRVRAPLASGSTDV